ncbi:hypothetical protein ACFL6H_06270, partial [Candidatus Latescibacterota bacterium]
MSMRLSVTFCLIFLVLGCGKDPTGPQLNPEQQDEKELPGNLSEQSELTDKKITKEQDNNQSPPGLEDKELPPGLEDKELPPGLED